MPPFSRWAITFRPTVAALVILAAGAGGMISTKLIQISISAQVIH